jgi:hypothetical protein
MQITPNSGSKFTDSTTYKVLISTLMKIKIQTTCNTDAIFITKGLCRQ